MQGSEQKAVSGLHNSMRRETAWKHCLRFPLFSATQWDKMQILGGSIRCLNSAKISTESVVYSTTVLGMFDYIAMLSDSYGSGYPEQPNK